MLETLTIRHIALIDEVTIRFYSGLQVLTGETGAGKSIVVDAVNLILGGRADKELIRSGCEKASVEAVFTEKGNTCVAQFLEREEIEYDGQTVTIFREISNSGKNICRICGVVQPIGKLKELSALLMDMHGQSEHQFLADPERHLSFLDQTGDGEHKALIARAQYDCGQFLTNHRAYAKLVRQNENREERVSTLRKNLSELRGAALQPGEDLKLREEKKRLQEAEKESAGLRSAYEGIAAGENGASALSSVRNASDILKETAEKDSGIRELSGRCESLYYELEEIAYQLSTLIDRLDADPARLGAVEDRLDLIRRLERKYSLSCDELCHAEEDMEEEYKTLAGLEERLNEMAAEHRKLLSAYRQTARTLTESRRRISADFENRMMKELNDLGMGNTRFSVRFKENETGKPVMPTEAGDDRIEFMISPNPGEPLKPLARIASGGELSRLMLAIKTLEADHTGVESMVFDEIDTGISGKAAQVVAEKLAGIARHRQVICVTHLPQIAAAADHQFLVRKAVSDERTNTFVTELDRIGRIEEIGRMISGAEGITDGSKAYASSMLSAADELKSAGR